MKKTILMIAAALFVLVAVNAQTRKVTPRIRKSGNPAQVIKGKTVLIRKSTTTKVQQKKRLNMDITELSRLVAGELPTPNSGKIEDFYKFMRIVSNKLKLTYEPMTIWYILCLALD